MTAGKSGCRCLGKGKSQGSSCCRTASGKFQALLASLPAMTYRVGDLSTNCYETAMLKAKETESPVKFMVEEKLYDSQNDAAKALTDLMEKRVTAMTSVSYVAGDETFHCSVSAKQVADKAKTKVRYRLAGFDFDDRAQATKAAEKAADAAKSVAMSFKADGKSVSCAASSKASGKTVTYCVGKQETTCEVTARRMLVATRIGTIVETVAASLQG